MLVGLTGAHRAGKTTLADKFAAQGNFTFAATSVSKIMKKHGMDPAKDYCFARRMDMQETILTELDAFYAQQKPLTIVDRTPLDAAAYLLADVRRQNITGADNDRVAQYLRRVFDITNRRFSLMVFVPSTLPLVHAEGKAPAEVAYTEHISVLINGLKADQRMHVMHASLGRHQVDLSVRLRALDAAVQKTLDRLQRESEDVADCLLH